MYCAFAWRSLPMINSVAPVEEHQKAADPALDAAAENPRVSEAADKRAEEAQLKTDSSEQIKKQISLDPSAQYSAAVTKPAPEKHGKVYDFIHQTLPAITTFSASILHGITGAGRITKILPSPIQNFLEKHTLNFSKLINVTNFSVKSFDAFKKGEGFLGLARLLYPLVVPFLKLEDVFLGSGLSSGLTMMYFGQEKMIKKSDDNLDNIFLHLKQFKKTLKEIFTKGAGPNGVIFKKWGGEEPHTMFLSGVFNFTGGAMGLLFKYVFKLPGQFGVFARRLSAIVRNIPGGALSDYAKIFSNNSNLRKAAWGYLGTSGIDLSEPFLEEENGTTASHFTQALNNIANYYYIRGDETTSNA